MKQLYAVLVLGLVLVFALGSVASAGILRGEDYDRPIPNPFDIDEPDDDHPWGGDRVIGNGGSGDRDVEPQVEVISVTDYLYIDLFLNRLYQLYTEIKPDPIKKPTYEARPKYKSSYRVPRPSSRTYSRKVVAR